MRVILTFGKKGKHLECSSKSYWFMRVAVVGSLLGSLTSANRNLPTFTVSGMNSLLWREGLKSNYVVVGYFRYISVTITFLEVSC